MEIVVFSGQKNFTKGIQQLIQANPNYSNCTIVEAVGDKLLEQADNFYNHGTKVFVARGSNYQHLKQRYDIPLIQVRSTYEEILISFKNAKKVSNSIAILGFGAIYDMILRFKKISHAEFLPLEVTDSHSHEQTIQHAAANGIDTFVGGLASKKICEVVGVQHVMLEISQDSLSDALEQAEELLRTNLEKDRNNIITKNIIESSANAIIALDRHRQISFMNQLARRLFKNHSREDFLQQLFESPDHEDLFQRGIDLDNRLMTIREKDHLVSVSFLNREDAIDGAIVYITDSKTVISSENKLRTQLHNRGHVAKNTFRDIIGKSPQITETIDWAKRIAKADNNILINGETGTGKELFSQSIHNFSQRKKGPFIAINCAALSTSLLESELFGYEKGAFTGANSEGKIGIFERAHLGTVFLDEIGEISGDLQAKLLRVIQEKEVVRVGGDRVIPVDVRIISATHKNLKHLAKTNEFRSDLYYRLAVLELNLPALRERKTDIPLIISNYLAKNYPSIKIEPENLNYFANFPYEGNIRQLINLIERSVVMTDRNKVSRFIIEKVCREEFLYDEPMQTKKSDSFTATQQPTEYDDEKNQIEDTLRKNFGNRKQTAEELGISTTTLWRKLKKYGI